MPPMTFVITLLAGKEEGKREEGGREEGREGKKGGMGGRREGEGKEGGNFIYMAHWIEI